MSLRKHWWIFIAAPVGFAAFLWIGGEVVKLLWNWLLPPLFGFPRLSFWQAFGILALCRILFGNYSSGGRTPSRRIGQRIAERVEQRWEERWEARWAEMTPEERERLRDRIRERRGPFEATGPAPTE